MDPTERYVFVNLKRFEVPRARGGICPTDEPFAWIQSVIEETAAAGLGALPRLRLVYLLPEGLLAPALEARRLAGATTSIAIGCQGVHWEDLRAGANFGAFTTLLPAQAAAAMGASWTLIGHSEERRAKLQMIEAYDPQSSLLPEQSRKATHAIDTMIRMQVRNALRAGLNVLLCVGETAEQRGEGSVQEIAERLQGVLEDQISHALSGAAPLIDGRQLVIGYEPVWAIGPGKQPPGPEYIELAASLAKRAGRRALRSTPKVVYGGGLKLANAGTLGGIGKVDGGLVALTSFTGDIGFAVDDLVAIVESYLAAVGQREQP